MGTINTISDLQKVFGDKPLNSLQPISQPASMPTKGISKGKVVLYAVGGIVLVVGLYQIFSSAKDLFEGPSKKDEELEKMKKSIKKKKEEGEVENKLP